LQAFFTTKKALYKGICGTLVYDLLLKIYGVSVERRALILTIIRDGRELTIDLILQEELPAEYSPTSNRSGTGLSSL